MRMMIVAMVVAVAACGPAANGAPPAGGAEPKHVTVHDVLTMPALAGKVVAVKGRCLGYSAPTVAMGAPPVTRSDWQLEEAGEAVWVTGPLVAGCSSTVPAESSSVIVALVAQDTVGLGGTRVVRQYLIRR